MQTEYLKYFLNVVQEGTIAAAARKSFITPQGLRRALGALESDLGCALFVRNNRKLVLSKAGELLLNDAEEIVAHQDHMFEVSARLLEEPTALASCSVVAYVSPSAFDTSLFLPIVDSIEDSVNDVRYYQCNNREIVEQLLAHDDGEEARTVHLGMLDFFDPCKEENDELIDRLEQAGYVFVPFIRSYDEALVSTRSKLSELDTLSHEEIKRQMVVIGGRDIRNAVEKVFGSESIYMVTSDNMFRYHVVQKNDAITFVPAYSRINGKDPEGTVRVPVQDTYYMTLGFVAKQEALENEHIKRIMFLLDRYFSKHADSPYLSYNTGMALTYKK